MPELPEIVVFCQQMEKTILNKEIHKVEILQPKCLNRSVRDYSIYLPGQKTQQVNSLGKWISLKLQSNDQLLINLGMGGELIYFTDQTDIPEKVIFYVQFTDGTGFYVTLWWFGYFHFVKENETNIMTDNLGDDPLQINFDEFTKKLDGKRGRIKPFLLNQKNYRGIGNFYIQEILFQAKLHPLRLINSVSKTEMQQLYTAIRNVMQQSIELGSSSYEKDFFGELGNYSLKELSFAYEENAVCPTCGTESQKIKTGSNAQYICPQCQQLPGEKSAKLDNYRKLEIHKTGKE
jgi:formamidopyrimidine-DNA glycosylase